MKDADYISYGGSEENRTILQIGQEVSSRIGISQFRARRVQWVEKYGKGKYVLPDLPAIHQDTLFLSDKVVGKLTPEDWRALLCSSLIYDERLRLNRRLGRLATLSGFVLVFPAAYLLSSILLSIWFPRGLPSYSIRGLGVPFIAMLIGGFLLVGAITSPYMRHLIFIADRITAQELGLRGPLLMCLRKIETLGLEQYPFRRGRFAHVPSVADRIQRLSKD
jgi:hypothetical protein